MIEIVAVKEPREDTDNIHYIADSDELTSMTKKYNYAIEHFCVNSSEKYFCFRHDDASFNTPTDIMKYKLDKLFEDKSIGVVGLIGTYLLESSGVWWLPQRVTNGVGEIIQGRPDGTTFPMRDFPGLHKHIATVDGCCMWLSKSLIDAGIRFDENLEGYHFYDADICCQSLAAGYTNAVIDISVTHMSVGNMPANFSDYQRVFLEKWTKKIDHWPIGKFTNFK